MKELLYGTVMAAALSVFGATGASGQVNLIAKRTLTESSAELYADLSGLDYNLENGAPANLLGGLGSGLACGYGDTFLAVPDRGPNAVSFDSLVDDTASYVPRFHTLKMNLQPNGGQGLPFTLTPTLEATTLLYGSSPLVYGSGDGLGVGPGNEYAYLLTTGSGVSEITALNQHEFLVDERDGKGLGDGSKAKVKQIFKIDLANAVDVINMDGSTAAANAVSKTLFLDVVKVLTANGISSDQIPAKLEGLALGPDVDYHGTMHTLWVANDNDFLQDLNGANTNPNQFFVFGFTDADLGGSEFVAQQPKGSAK